MCFSILVDWQKGTSGIKLGVLYDISKSFQLKSCLHLLFLKKIPFHLVLWLYITYICYLFNYSLIFIYNWYYLWMYICIIINNIIIIIHMYFFFIYSLIKKNMYLSYICPLSIYSFTNYIIYIYDLFIKVCFKGKLWFFENIHQERSLSSVFWENNFLEN